jgi:hypothetical protein
MSACWPRNRRHFQTCFGWYNWGVYKDSTGKLDVLRLAEKSVAVKGGLGCPDTLPDRDTHAYPYFRTQKGNSPILMSVQDAGAYKKFNSGVYTYTGMINFGTSDTTGMQANYMVWDGWAFGTVYTPTGATAALNARGFPINSTIPTNITS